MKNYGRPPNSIKELCREHVFNDQFIQLLANIAKNTNEQTRDRIKAIELLMDRGYGKAEQNLDVTTHDGDRPSTDVLIQTITAIRAELDASRERIGIEAGK